MVDEKFYSIKIIKQSKYFLSDNYILDHNGSDKTLGEIQEDGSVRLFYPSKLLDKPYLERILKFREKLKILGIKFSGNFSPTINLLEEDSSGNKNLIKKLNK